MKNLVLSILLLAATLPTFSQKPKTEVSRFQYQIDNQTRTARPVDTILTGSQYHHPLYPSPASWSELGNAGLPAVINQYRPIREAGNPLVFEGADGYGSDLNSLAFYSANSPFSLLNYNSGGTADKNGQTIRALFARNLKKKGNITVLGNYTNSEGHFSKQNCNSSAIRINYILNRTNYKLVTGLSRNSFSFSENGGLKSDEQLSSAYLPGLLAVNLSGAAVKMSVLTWQGAQTGTFRLSRRRNPSGLPADSVLHDSLPGQLPGKRSPVIVHTFRITNTSRKYSDASSDAGFYQNTYSEGLASNDSISFLSWTNNISLLSDTLHFGKFPLLFKGGLDPDFYRYQHADSISYGYSVGLSGKITKKGEFSLLEFSGKWAAIGYSAGDYGLKAFYSMVPSKTTNGSEFTLELFARGCSPDPVIRNYQSNHFRWNNDFRRQHESGLNLQWNIPAVKAALVAGFVSNINRIYFDSTGLPAQLQSGMSVLSFKGSKEFKAGPFRSTLTGLVQYSTSDAIRLPLFVGTTSTFMHHDIKFKATGGEIQAEYGIDLSYSTGFYGYAYLPATGVFYPENERVLGNYPYLNAFVQMKVKRTRVFVQWCHTFADLLAEQSFAVLHYPSMRPHLKYGIYWHFYD